MSKNSLLEKFLVKLHNAKGGNLVAAQIAEQVGLSANGLQILIDKGILQQTSFGLPDYRVIDPVLWKLGLKPHK